MVRQVLSPSHLLASAICLVCIGGIKNGCDPGKCGQVTTWVNVHQVLTEKARLRGLPNQAGRPVETCVAPTHNYAVTLHAVHSYGVLPGRQHTHVLEPGDAINGH